jgi:hypothetical protein
MPTNATIPDPPLLPQIMITSFVELSLLYWYRYDPSDGEIWCHPTLLYLYLVLRPLKKYVDERVKEDGCY